jgi:hypothetical protein
MLINITTRLQVVNGDVIGIYSHWNTLSKDNGVHSKPVCAVEFE